MDIDNLELVNDNESRNVALPQVVVTYNFDEVLPKIHFKFNNTKYMAICQNIMCFDTEASSGLYDTKTDKVHGFSHGNANRYLLDYVHRYIPVSLSYAWMYCIYDEKANIIYVIIGRTEDSYYTFKMKLDSIVKFRSNISKKRSVKMFAFVHNLSYDMGNFLRNVYGDENIKVFARSERKPIKCNIVYNRVATEYRCTVFLTQKTLASWCEDEDLPVSKVKVKGDFYLPIRTPYTPLDDKMQEYIVADVVSMCYGMMKYKDKYHSLENIPMTATGEVRRRFKHMAHENPDYALRCYAIAQSYDHELLCELMATFQGGWTHANAKYMGKLLKPMKNRFLTGYDFASSYPAVMCSFGGFPVSEFVQEDPFNFDTYKNDDPNHCTRCFFGKFRFTNVRSKLDNSYWSFSKVEDPMELGYRKLKKTDNPNDWIRTNKCKIDNGRINRCEAMTVWMTNVDWDIFKRAYYYDSVECLKLYSASAGYLDKELIELILDAYADKTALKDVGGSKYDSSKKLINSAYGVFVTKILTDIVGFGSHTEIDEDGEEIEICGWTKRDADEYDYAKLLEKMKPTETITYYAVGVWVTAAARWRLWKGAILPCDKSVVYCDTDSAKMFATKADIMQIEKFNKWIIKEEMACAKFYGIDPKRYCPCTPKGKPKQLGVFALDGDVLEDGFSIYQEFKTLGAKRYAYKDNKGVVHTTIAGLPKSAGGKVIKKVDDLSNQCKWNTKQSGKKMHYYNDEQPECKWVDCHGIPYISRQRYGIAILPTTFDLSVTEEFRAFCMWLCGYNDPNWVKSDYNYAGALRK